MDYKVKKDSVFIYKKLSVYEFRKNLSKNFRDIELFQKANKKPSLMHVILRIR